MAKLLRLGVVVTLCVFANAAFALPTAAGPSGGTAFSITRLNTTNGDSEPAISIGAGGTMAITGLPWLRSSVDDFATRLWTGSFGSVPTLQGGIDTGLVKPGSTVVGALDAEHLKVEHLQLHQPSLDDVFLAKTGRTLEGAAEEEEQEQARRGLVMDPA